MRLYVYSWASSDGFRHEGEIKAPSKDEAYRLLRERGVRPIRVTERIVPVVRKGFRGLRKRDWFVVLGLFGVAVIGVVMSYSSVAPVVTPLQMTDSETSPAAVSLAVPKSGARSALTKVTSDPEVAKEVEQILAERAADEERYRQRFIQRVRAGTLDKEDANKIFRAMGFAELP